MVITKGRMRLLAAGATIILSAIGLAGTSAAPARAQTCCVAYDIYLYASPYFLYAHAHNYPIQTTDNPAESQWWQLIRPATIQRINNQGTGTAYEIELENTGQCFNNVPFHGIGIVYLDSCQPGDLNEYYWPDRAAAGADYLRNVAQSYTFHYEYAYVTANSCGMSGTSPNYVLVADYYPGCGAWAWWEFFAL